MEESGRGLIQGTNGIFLEGLRKTKNLSQDSRYPGRDLNSELP
jgi:hypothetical protein